MPNLAIIWWLETHEIDAEDGDPVAVAMAHLDDGTCMCCGVTSPL